MTTKETLALSSIERSVSGSHGGSSPKKTVYTTRRIAGGRGGARAAPRDKQCQVSAYMEVVLEVRNADGVVAAPSS